MNSDIIKILRQAYVEYGNEVFCDSHKLNTYLHDLLAKFPSERKKLSVAISENILTSIIADRDAKKRNAYISILTSTYGFGLEVAEEIIETLYYTVNFAYDNKKMKEPTNINTFKEKVEVKEKDNFEEKELIFGNRYVVESKVEENEIYITYIAKCMLLKRKVKLHLLKKKVSKKILEKIRIRVEELAQINHENFVKVFDFCITGDTCYVVDELVTGSSVHDIMKLGGSFEESEVLNYAVQLADVLENLHDKNICNFGLSPMSVLIVADEKVKLQYNYFYYVEQLDNNISKENIIYCSPEMARGEYVDTNSDVYLYGLVTYELIAGEPPFKYKTTSIAVALQHLEESPMPPSQKGKIVSLRLEKLILNALEKESSKRYNIKKIKWNLNAIINGFEIEKNTNYEVRLIRKAIVPFKVDVYVDGNIHSKRVNQEVFDLTLSEGQHYIEIGCGDLVNAIFSGYGAIRSILKDRLKISVSGKKTITYGMNRWSGGLKLINEE